MVFIVIPAFNEEKNIGRVIRDLFQHGYKNIVVVDDGSDDNTALIAKQLGAKVLRQEVNRGQGAALQTGNEFALREGAEIIVHFDADGQLMVEDIEPAVVKMQQENLDIVLGSRFLDKKSKIPWIKKLFILPLARFFNNIFSGLKLTDVHNGFRVLSRKAAESIEITQDGMAHNSEITAQIKKHGLSFVEYPVEVKYEEFGQGIGGGMRIIRDLVISKFIKL